MKPLTEVLGCLQELECYVYHDGPQLYSCYNDSGKFFFAVAVERDEEKDTYLFCVLTSGDLGRLAKEQYREVILGSTERYKAYFYFGTSTKPGEETIERYGSAIPEKWLPSES